MNDANATPPSDPDALASAQAEVRRLVWAGFDPPDAIVEHIESTWDWDESLDVDWLRDEIDAEFAKKRLEEAAWPAATDIDRLSRAFDALNDAGVIAAHNAGYTQGEGIDDVSQAYHDAERRSAIVGWCFYTAQDIETALAVGELYLAFGIFDNTPDEPRSRALAERIKAALEREGLRVEWNGDIGTRLKITPFHWQKRND